MDILSRKNWTVDFLYLHYDFKILDCFLLWFLFQTACLISFIILPVYSENSIWEHYSQFPTQSLALSENTLPNFLLCHWPTSYLRTLFLIPLSVFDQFLYENTTPFSFALSLLNLLSENTSSSLFCHWPIFYLKTLFHIPFPFIG